MNQIAYQPQNTGAHMGAPAQPVGTGGYPQQQMAPAPVPPGTPGVSLEQQVAELFQRVAALEARPQGRGGGGGNFKPRPMIDPQSGILKAGKHKDMHISQVPENYQRWMVDRLQPHANGAETFEFTDDQGTKRTGFASDLRWAQQALGGGAQAAPAPAQAPAGQFGYGGQAPPAQPPAQPQAFAGAPAGAVAGAAAGTVADNNDLPF